MVFVKFETRFKQEHIKKLEQLAELDGVSVAETIREAVREYLIKRSL